MTMISRPCVLMLLRFAMRVAPSERTDWFKAMASEIEHLPDAKAGAFAAGVLMVALQTRVSSRGFMMTIAHGLLVSGATAWAALNIWFAGRMSVAGDVSLEIVAYGTAAIFGIGAIVTGRLGVRATIMLGAPLFLLLGLVASIIRTQFPHSAVTDLHFALVVEDAAVVAVALLIAAIVSRLDSSERIAC